MMLAGLLNIPHNDDDWQKWSWDHRLSHNRIRQGVLATYKANLTDYQIDPISPNDLEQFLQNNAQLHSDMLGITGLNGIDLLDVDLSNDSQKVSWIQYHFLEHFYVESKLGVGS